MHGGENVFEFVEGQVLSGIQWLQLAIETLGALVICVGLVIAIIGLIRHAMKERGASFNPVRLAFARYLTLALELQLAADILATSIAPTWDQIGKLAAIAVIRTVLNYFLNKEMKEEEAAVEPAVNARDKNLQPTADQGSRA